jgi:predicted nucleotide-binding protein
MAKKRKQESTEKKPLELLISSEEANKRIEDRIVKGKAIKEISINSQGDLEAANKQYYKWDAYNSEMFRRIFTTEEIAGEYKQWISVAAISLIEPPLSKKVRDFHDKVDKKIHRLESITERLELIPLSEHLQQDYEVASQPIVSTETNKVFIVHGHDEKAKNQLEIFLAEIGLEPIVLHRQPDEGQTIIEKFEKHSDVGFAIIMLTPDEIAYPSKHEQYDDSKREKESRARPNVIFEFGYFIGKLGRSRVCCLYKGDVTLPSDVSGIIYKEFKSEIEEVAYSIMKDLKACGYSLK